VSAEEAVRAAKLEAERRDLGWMEPIKVWQELRHYVIRTHAGFRGGGMFVYVDIHSGSVTRIGGPISR